MAKFSFIYVIASLSILLSGSSYSDFQIRRTGNVNITPNQFKGNDIQRIRLAIDAAKKTNYKVFIPSENSNGTNIWLIDSAILLPSNITVILDNCTIQLSDSCRDNMFRSDNIIIGNTDQKWNSNISIIGVGKVTLKGALNPRATGDGAKTLGTRTYGTDAGKSGRKQTGDSRNIMILIAYVDGFTLKNLEVENSHMWAFSFERTLNADISDIRFYNPTKIIVNGKKVTVLNKDGIDLRKGCKNFRINNISGLTGDDFIALTNFHVSRMSGSGIPDPFGIQKRESLENDIIEQVFISNISCESDTRAVAIRASDSASIRNVFINGLMYKGPYNAILVGGRGYGKPNLPGNINNIHVMNIMGNGISLIHVEEAIADCSFLNCVYTGSGNQVITYSISKEKPVNFIPNDTIDKGKTKNIITKNLIKIHQ
jgi:hypothetical protein